jgi:hypothetical protein
MRSGLVETGLFLWHKAFLRGHHYVLQNVRVLEAIHVALYMMEHSSPFMGDPVATVNRHMTTAFAGTHTESCNTLPEVCKLKPAHHFLS